MGRIKLQPEKSIGTNRNIRLKIRLFFVERPNSKRNKIGKITGDVWSSAVEDRSYFVNCPDAIAVLDPDVVLMYKSGGRWLPAEKLLRESRSCCLGSRQKLYNSTPVGLSPGFPHRGR